MAFFATWDRKTRAFVLSSSEMSLRDYSGKIPVFIFSYSTHSFVTKLFFHFFFKPLKTTFTILLRIPELRVSHADHKKKSFHTLSQNTFFSRSPNFFEFLVLVRDQRQGIREKGRRIIPNGSFLASRENGNCALTRGQIFKGNLKK